MGIQNYPDLVPKKGIDFYILVVYWIQLSSYMFIHKQIQNFPLKINWDLLSFPKMVSITLKLVK